MFHKKFFGKISRFLLDQTLLIGYTMHIVKQHSKEFKMQLSERELAIIKSVTKALASTENYNTDGSVNWNFVDGDVFMDIKPAEHEFDSHYEMFNRFASVVEAGILVQGE